MRRNASGVFLPLARRGQSAERAGATPLFGAFGSPGGGPGAGVAPARGTLEQRQSARIPERFQMRFDVEIAGGSEARSGVRSWLLFANEVGRGSHDCDAAKRIQIEKIFVTCHDRVCAAIYGRLKELVILRITRRANRLKYVDDFDERCDAFEQRVAPLPADVAIEFRGVQFLDQFT